MGLPQKSKLLQYIEQLESETAWSDEQFPCFKCYKKGSLSCRTIVGRLCISCIEKELKTFAEHENLNKRPLNQIIKALSLDGKLHNRLTVIWRIREIWNRFSDNVPDSTSLLIMLIQNLGYKKNHPLAHLVRVSAVDACKNLGEPALPFLLEMCSKNPWQLYVNIILSAAAIAPDDLRVRKLVEKASEDSNPEVRKRAYASISDNNSQWAAGLMRKLKNDPDPSVMEFVKIMKNNNKPSNKLIPVSQKKKKEIMSHLEELINKHYSLDILKAIFPLYLRKFVVDKKTKILSTLSPNTLTKSELVKLFAKIFADNKHFQIFIDSLQDDVKKILNILVWEGGIHNVDKFKKKFGSEIISFNKENPYYRYSGKPNPPYLLFRILAKSHNYSFSPSSTPYYLSLDDELREQFKNYLDQPLDYNITPVKEIKETEFNFQDQGQIISQIILFYTYIQQDNLKFSKSGDKILVNSIKQMCDYCNIKEFYDDSDNNLRYIRTKMIADLLLDIRKEEFTDPVDLLKTLTDELLSAKSSGKFILRELLFHIKGLHHLSGGYNGQALAKNEKKVRLSMFNLIKEMPVSQWVSVENIIKYCSYRAKDFEIIDRGLAADYLYFQRFYQTGYQWIKESVYYDIYMDVLFIPFIKSFIFLCAGLGILDIAYGSPKNKVFQEKGNPYLSLFDSLKYVRLTSLGAYLLGLSEDYDVKFEVKEAKVTLDDQRLIVNLDAPDTLKSLVLDKIADKITDTCFAVNYNSFLKSCASKEDIRQKIRLFRENISSAPPPVWKEFINEIMNKINPMTEEKSMKVYKLKPNDELISLIAKDDVLKKYILKAEDFHIIINSKHLRPVKARLEEFGYLLDKI